jgi:hypothetical protein
MKPAAFIKRPSKSSLNSESLDISRQVAAYCLDCGKNGKILSVQQHPHLVVRTADLHVLRVPNRSCAVWPPSRNRPLHLGEILSGLLSFPLLSSLVGHIPSLRDEVRFIMLRKGERIKANRLFIAHDGASAPSERPARSCFLVTPAGLASRIPVHGRSKFCTCGV